MASDPQEEKLVNGDSVPSHDTPQDEVIPSHLTIFKNLTF